MHPRFRDPQAERAPEAPPAARRSGYRKRGIRLQCIDAHWLAPVMALQRRILASLARPDLLQPFAETFMRRHFREQGRVVGALCAGRLVGFRCLYFPDPEDREWNLGFDLGIEPEERRRLANLQMLCVDPRFRGLGLGLAMNRHALRLLRRRPELRHLCATVSPHNAWNLRILFATGLRVRRLKEKYGGKLRYVMHRSLRPAPPPCDGERRTVARTDFATQSRLLARGWIGLDFDGSCDAIRFARPEP